MVLDIYGFVYAATIAIGGILGYATSASVPSLTTGLFFGGLLGFGAFQTSQNGSNVYLSLGTSLLLSSLMSYRFINTGKVIPAGLVASISFVNVIRLLMKIALNI